LTLKDRSEFIRIPSLLKPDWEVKQIGTLITHLFTGRPARSIRNHSVENYLETATKLLTWPLQGVASDDIYSETRKQNLADPYPLLGQGSRLLKRGQNAKGIINKIVSSANTIISSSVIMNTVPISDSKEN
jgi:NAD(P)H-dependent flavin oxidoreductase YrpB (nitropropane dioxygenase family)